MKVDYSMILSPRNRDLPLNLQALSGGLPRTELEIGFGNGEFTVKHAAAHPDTFVIGMEVSPSCVTRCVRRASAAESSSVANLAVVCTDARYMMKELFADASLDRVRMNFPCPWPKTRHARRRVTASEFAADLAAVLKLDGIFELVTDEEWYALDARETLGRHEALAFADYEINPLRPVTTKYERKWLEQGKSIYRLTVTKTKAFTVARETWGFSWKDEKGEEMHIKTGKPLPEKGLGFLFDASGARGEARWVFKKHYTAPGGTKNFLIETVSADDEFEQRYYLKAVERDGDTLIKLDGTAKVYLTPAVRFAVEDLGRRLSEA